MYAYEPEHPLANKAGKVMEHVYVMSNKIGRPIEPNECVHHIDRNRSNNLIENLLLMTLSDHAKLHAREDKGSFTLTVNCITCEKEIVTTDSSRKFCSYKCAQSSREKFTISNEELAELVWKIPTSKIAHMLGVSDKAIQKRCEREKIVKPGRGYWAKLKAGEVFMDTFQSSKLE